MAFSGNSQYILNLLSSQNIYKDAESLPQDINFDELQRFIAIRDAGATWSLNKTFTNNYKEITTKTYSQYLQSDYWCMRHTTLNNVALETFRKDFVEKLNGSVYQNSTDTYELEEKEFSKRCFLEKEYIHTIINVMCLNSVVSADKNSAFVEVRNTYKLDPSWLLNKREFSQWVFVKKAAKSGCGNYEESIVLTLRAAQQESEATRGYYISVEFLKYDLQKSSLTWSMATCSDAGGNLPKFLQKLGIDKAISDDVPSFLKYINY